MIFIEQSDKSNTYFMIFKNLARFYGGYAKKRIAYSVCLACIFIHEIKRFLIRACLYNFILDEEILLC